MLRKSVETRDWLHGSEPRMVRPVMKRVIEELTAIESQVVLEKMVSIKFVYHYMLNIINFCR